MADIANMRVAVAFSENYGAEIGNALLYRQCQGWAPPGDRGKGGLWAFLTQLRVNQAGDPVARYASPTIDLLGGVIERVCGESLSSVLGREVWTRIGAESTGYVTVDGQGFPRAAGGVGSTLRDLARFGALLIGSLEGAEPVLLNGYSWGEYLRRDGTYAEWAGSNFAKFYRDRNITFSHCWYSWSCDYPCFFASGIFGQGLFLFPDQGVVIARFGSAMDPLSVGERDLMLSGIRSILRAAVD